MATAGSASRTTGQKLSDGAATRQADGVYAADTAVSKAGVDTYLFAAGLSALYGEQLELSAITLLMLDAEPAKVAPLVVGAGSCGGPHSVLASTAEVSLGDTLLWLTQSANG